MSVSADFRFQVNLSGIIDLLSNHLYSSPQVYVRELLQNAVDAITARERHDPLHRGVIHLERLGERGAAPTLVVTDNGVGLTEAEVHSFLATIGRSSKRESFAPEDFLGQFGIEILSCFIVSDEIVVITRSVQEGSRTVEWRGRLDGTFTLRALEHDAPPGTQVYLRARQDGEEFFEADYVREAARRFGGLLPYRIEFTAGGGNWTINEDPPWRQPFPSETERRQALLDYGQGVFGTEFFDAVPLRSRIGGVEGVAFIQPHSMSAASKRTHRIYLKNMLLTERGENLLPDWAFFVKAVINAADLRPTASRESFYEDASLEAAREALGECLRQYLLRLAREDPQRLDRFIGLHGLAMKALAVEDEEFYRMFVDLLPFETSLGEMKLGEIRRKGAGLQYVTARDQFRQISSIAAAQSLCIVNAGYVYDAELLELLPERFEGQEVERVSVSDLMENLEDLSLEEREEVFGLVRAADLVLQPFQCAAEVRKFEPARLPTLYTINESATFLRSLEQSKELSDELWSSVLDRIAEEPAAAALAQLCFNYHNPLVRRLAAVADRRVVRRAVEMLYVQALLLGHYPLASRELKLLNEGLLGLIEQVLDAHQGERP